MGLASAIALTEHLASEKLNISDLAMKTLIPIACIIIPVTLIGCIRKEKPVELEIKRDSENNTLPFISKEDHVFKDDRSPHILDQLEKYELPDPLIKPFFENQMEWNFISRAEELLTNNEVQTDHEFSLFLSLRLGLVYSSKRIKDYEKALSWLESAIILASRDREKFRSQLAMAYKWSHDILVKQKRYSQAINIAKKIVLDCQRAGTGKNKDLIAAIAISDIARNSLMVEQQKESLEKYLESVVNTYANSEVAYAALTQLYDLSKREGNQIKANYFMQKMESYPVSWEYRRHSSNIIEKWQKVESLK